MMSRKMYALSRYAQPIPLCFIYQTNNPLYRSIIFSGDTNGPCNSQGAYGSAWRTDRRRRLLRFASLHGKKSYIQSGQQRPKKQGEIETESEKEMQKKKKREDWRKWGYKRNGCAIQEGGGRGNAVLCLFFFACASPFLLLYIG